MPLSWVARVGTVALVVVSACVAASCAPANSGGRIASASRVPSGAGAGSSTPLIVSSPTTTGPPPVVQLPRGGRVLLPDYRLVGFAGAPGAPALGRLGIGGLDDWVRELDAMSAKWAGGRKPQPTLELLATIVQGEPGKDGKWRTRLSDKVIADFLAAARKRKAILLLGIQPGRARFLDEVKAYARWLREPDVGVALDPEWAMGPRQVPMRAFGHTTGSEINGVTAWVAGVVKRGGLPQKAVVVHELSPNIVRDETRLVAHSEVALIKSVDGIGSPALKVDTWRLLTTGMPKVWRAGFKIFYVEDREHGPLMTAAQVNAMKPQVDYVLFE